MLVRLQASAGAEALRAALGGKLAEVPAPTPVSDEVRREAAAPAFHEAVMDAIRAHRDFDQRTWMREVLQAGEAA
jgi:hypothetical protein